MAVADDGTVTQSEVYRAAVRNHARLAYAGVAAWLDGHGRAPAGIGQVDGLERQLRTQDRLAGFLRTRREAEGALDFDRTEIKPVMGDGVVKDLQGRRPRTVPAT